MGKTDFDFSDFSDYITRQKKRTQKNDTELKLNQVIYSPYKVDENGNAVFPENITEIPAYAFYRNPDLLRAVIPESVKCIGPFAFAECDTLESVYMNNVENINDGAFFRCKSLFHIRFSPNLQSLGDGVFF